MSRVINIQTIGYLWANLEVSRVHAQLEGVQLAESTHSSHEVVHQSDCFTNCTHDAASMLLDWPRAEAHVSPVGEVYLSLGVSSQHPAKEGTE